MCSGHQGLDCPCSMAVSHFSAGGGVSLSLLPLALALLCVPTYDASLSVYSYQYYNMADLYHKSLVGVLAVLTLDGEGSL